MRVISVALAALLCGLSVVPSLADPEDYCGGKYLAAANVLDAAYGPYGTAYSGGDFTGKRDNVGATIDLYRLLAGLEPADFGDVDDAMVQAIDTMLPELPISTVAPAWEHHWDRGPKLSDMVQRHGAEWFDQQLRAALAIAEAPDPRVTPEQKARVAYLLDVATSPNPRPDWWLTKDPLDLSPVRQITARVAQESDLLAWLQMMAVQSARPENIVPYAKDATFETYFLPILLREIDAREQTGAAAAWRAARALLVPLPLPSVGSGDNSSFFDEFRVSWQDVKNCTVDPAAYALRSMVLTRPGLDWVALDSAAFSMLPEAMRDKLLRDRVLEYFVSRVFWRDQTPARLAEIAAKVSDPVQRAWVNVGRSFLAANIDEFIAIHDGTPLDSRTYRLLNLLSADNLRLFMDAQGRAPDEKAALTPYLYQRLFALGRWREALDLREELAYLNPERAEEIRRIDESRSDDEIKAALIALTGPWTVWIRGVPLEHEFNGDPSIQTQSYGARSNDLPEEIASAGFLRRDMETWAMFPSRWGEYQVDKESGGFALAELSRWNYRKGTTPADPPESFVYAREAPKTDWGQDRQLPPIADMIAVDELRQMGPTQGWRRKINHVLLIWAVDTTKLKERLAINSEPIMPWAMVQLIKLTHESCRQDLPEDSPGYTANRLLRKYFPFTPERKSLPDHFKFEKASCR